LKKGELVLIFSEDEKYLVKVSDRKFNTRSGILDLSKLKKSEFGDKIKTHIGKTFYMVRPTLSDILEHLKRMPQIITPKDIGLILAYTGISPNSLVVDAGSGSAFLAISLANYVCCGKVVTYEKDKKIFKVAKENIEKTGLKNIVLKNRDITKGIQEKNVDLITLDVQHPEKAVEIAYRNLKVGGQLVVYSPTVDELVVVAKKIKKIKGLSNMRIVENIVREWQAERTVRPKTMGLMHTGFLIFVRKIS
jgi:tRNA (adenine57-N1/adenine58-N1)-methyltransferase